MGDLGIASFPERIRFDIDGGNHCILHGRHCLLSANYRPSQGLLRYALGGYRHVNMYSEAALAEEWEPYREAMGELFGEYCDVGKDKFADATEENVSKLTRCLAGYRR